METELNRARITEGNLLLSGLDSTFQALWCTSLFSISLYAFITHVKSARR